MINLTDILPQLAPAFLIIAELALACFVLYWWAERDTNEKEEK